MKKIYVNLIPINAGGGLQNAINLIIGISELTNNTDYIFLVRNNKLHDLCVKYDLKFVKFEDSVISRVFFEFFYFANKRDNVIFTLFGGKPFNSNNNLTVSGCAFSNLFYPEIDFWGYLPTHKKIIKKIKDYFRLRSIKKSDYTIFETHILKKRAIEIRNFENDRTFVVKMAVNKLVADTKRISNANVIDIDKNKYNILYLGSAHPNKRQHLLISIAKELRKHSDDFCFITTMGKTAYAKSVLTEIEANRLGNHIMNIGTIASDKVGPLINEIDAMINIAQLESFSNNFIEAWTFKKPLIVTDSDWSRDSCLKSALYVNLGDVEDTAKKLYELISNKALSSNLISTYEETLNTYLDYKEKTIKYIEIIENIGRRN